MSRTELEREIRELQFEKGCLWVLVAVLAGIGVTHYLGAHGVFP